MNLHAQFHEILGLLFFNLSVPPLNSVKEQAIRVGYARIGRLCFAPLGDER